MSTNDVKQCVRTTAKRNGKPTTMLAKRPYTGYYVGSSQVGNNTAGNNTSINLFFTSGFSCVKK